MEIYTQVFYMCMAYANHTGKKAPRFVFSYSSPICTVARLKLLPTIRARQNDFILILK